MADIAIKRKFYDKFGYFPEEVENSKDFQIRKLKNARSNVSRQKSNIKNATSIEEKLKAEKILKKYEKELKELEDKLGIEK